MALVIAQTIQIGMTPYGGIVLRYQRGHRLWSRPWASMWLLVATWAIDINTDPSCGQTMFPAMVLGSSLGWDATMAPGGSTGHSDQHGNMALGHQHGSSCGPDPWPQHGLQLYQEPWTSTQTMAAIGP